MKKFKIMINTTKTEEVASGLGWEEVKKYLLDNFDKHFDWILVNGTEEELDRIKAKIESLDSDKSVEEFSVKYSWWEMFTEVE
ncbi:MAG: hypothetical protein Q4P31_04300 [Andreesenia angusta]|nr:hypothetical protein [Andreesenia angusta]